MLTTAGLGFQILVLDDYSFSSTFSILIQGFPFGPPLFNILIILATDNRIIGIQRMIAGFSIIKINLIRFYYLHVLLNLIKPGKKLFNQQGVLS